MKVVSSKQTCESTNVSGTAARRVPVQIDLQKFYSYDWRHLIHIWLENRDSRLAEFWLLEDTYGQ